MLTISIITLASFILYRLADGRTLRSAIAAAAVIMLFALLCPELRNLPIQAYVLAGGVMWAGLQVVLPLAEGRVAVRYRRLGNISEVCVGRLSVAVMPQGV